MEDRATHHAAPPGAADEGAAPGVGAREAWLLLAPWLGYLFLAAAALLGLFTASGAPDDATYAAGLGTSIVAVIIIVTRMSRQLDGRDIGFLLPVTVTSSDLLFASIAVLAVLGLVGVILAATVGGALYGIGLALFAIAAALVFIEIKRYFDRRDAAR